MIALFTVRTRLFCCNLSYRKKHDIPNLPLVFKILLVPTFHTSNLWEKSVLLMKNKKSISTPLLRSTNKAQKFSSRI